MKKDVTYLLTGATGNLGGHVVSLLQAQDARMRALVLPHDPGRERLPSVVEVVEGDVVNPEDLARFLDLEGDLIVLHMAGIITIRWRFDQRVWDVNVQGTRNLVEACVARRVKKLVYVSSVHALPEKKKRAVIEEASSFDPGRVVGFYGKTKAEASQIVLDAVHEQGLHATIVHPAGIFGPGDFEKGYMTALLQQTAAGRLPAGVRGGYNFVDGRDVAQGVLAAAERGRDGEGYILGNRTIKVEEILDQVSLLTGRARVRHYVPVWLARLAVPFFALYARLRGEKPLFTLYSLHTLTSNSNFSIAKARKELGYHVRAFATTVKDALVWMEEEKMIEQLPKKRPGVSVSKRQKARSV